MCSPTFWLNNSLTYKLHRMNKPFQPFAIHVGQSQQGSGSQTSSTPIRKRSKSSRDADMMADSSQLSSYEWNPADHTQGQEYSQDSAIHPINFSQEMTDKLEALSVYTGAYDTQQGNSYNSFPDDASAFASAMAAMDSTAVASDNSNDSFHIPALPQTSQRRTTQITTAFKKPEPVEERKITIAPPLDNPFIIDATSIHYPTHRTKRTKTTLWLAAYKDKPRFVTDFEVEYMLGEGTFSNVYCVRSRCDGLLYAVKRLKTQLNYGEEAKQQQMLKEVCALAALCDCAAIVRYYSSWLEDGYLYIQTELCLQRSLDMFVKAPLPSFVTATATNSSAGLSESFLWKVFEAVATALDYMHKRGMVHLDIRPANIFISPVSHPGYSPNSTAVPYAFNAPAVSAGSFGKFNEDSRSVFSSYSSMDNGISCTPIQEEIEVNHAEVEANIISGRWTLRVGDLGLSRLTTDTTSLEEGEIRYCAAELINSGEQLDLTKCDVFSLGASVYELCKGERLEASEEGTVEWHDIRSGKYNDRVLSRYSTAFTQLLQSVRTASHRIM